MAERIELGIDAQDLRGASLGMGRYVKSFVMDLIKHPGFAVTLIANDAESELLKKRFANIAVNHAVPKDVRRKVLDVVWFPLGTMDFDTDAAHVLTLHDAGPYAKPLHDSLKQVHHKIRHRSVYRRAVRRADFILTLSEWSKAQIADKVDIDPDAMMAISPLPDSSWAPGVQELKIPELGEMPFVLAVAGWRGHHEMHAAIDAFRHVVRKDEVRLVIRGPLDLGAKVAFERVPHRLHLPDQLDDGDLRALYRNARTVIHPAPKSHWSQVAAEALCCGAAVLGAEGGSVTGILEESGCLIPIDDRGGWHDALEAAINDDEWTGEMRRNAATRWGKLSRRTPFETLAALFAELAQAEVDVDG